jgi:hypothetical protein
MLPIPSPATLKFFSESALEAGEYRPDGQNKPSVAPHTSKACSMLHAYPQQDGYDTVQIVKVPNGATREQRGRVYPSFKPQQSPDQTTVDVTFRMGAAQV